MIAFVVFMCLLSLTVQDEDLEYEPLPDYYATLNVSPTAKLYDIKKSFRKLAMQYHPDKNKEEGAQEKFQELSEAYAILSDAEKRREYDELYMDDSFEEQEAEASSEEAAYDEEETEQEDLDADSLKDEEVWGDLDDETLFKVLKFLADNEYEISKKTTRVMREANERFQSDYDQYTRYRDSEPRHHHRQEQPHYRWTREAQNDFHGHHGGAYGHESLPHGFCKTTVRWEGGVKVTNRSCY